MNLGLIKRIIAVVYGLIIIVTLALGFAYTNQVNNIYRENALIFKEGWTDHNQPIEFPYNRDDRTFELRNTIPEVFGDQMLVLKVYFVDYEAYIDGELVAHSLSNELFGVRTLVGNKEIWIPMEAQYEGKEILIKLQSQESIYRQAVTTSYITTRSGYAVHLLKNNIASVIIYIIFTVTGILEVVVATYYIFKQAKLIREYTFQSLLFAGLFSLVSAQWVICETRIPVVIFGNRVGFGVLTDITFLLMPILFFEITRTLLGKVKRIDNVFDGFMALSVLACIILCFTGVTDWAYTAYWAQILDLLTMIFVAEYSYVSLKEEASMTTKAAISLSNFVFLILAFVALFQYVKNTSSAYITIFLVDLLIYVMVQVILIYRRIGLNVEEEKEFIEAKFYAYTDDLTHLANRRQFYNVIESYNRDNLPADFTYIAIDVNRLKFYNDNMGHEAGDELLKGTAECISKAFSVYTSATIARMGGDEFAVIVVAPMFDIERSIKILNDLLSKWQGNYVNGIAVAVGYASVKQTGIKDVDILSKLADERMYHNKRQFYEESGFERRGSN